MNCTLILSIFAFLVSFEFFYGNFLITGAQPKAGTSHKMQSISVVFQRYIVRDIPLTRDISLVRYFWECSLAH